MWQAELSSHCHARRSSSSSRRGSLLTHAGLVVEESLLLPLPPWCLERAPALLLGGLVCVALEEVRGVVFLFQRTGTPMHSVLHTASDCCTR